MSEPTSTEANLTSPPSGREGLVDLRAVEFVKQQRADMPASEVVARAKELGLELELAQVYRTRDRERARAAKATKKETTMTPDPEETSSEETFSPPPAKGRPGRKPGGEDTKAGFVRSLPLDMPVKEVVERAKERGFDLTETYVYSVRGKMKGVSQTVGSKRGRKPKTGEPPTAASKPKKNASSSPIALQATAAKKPAASEEEKEFARLVVRVGLARAEQLLEQVKSKLAEMF